MQIHNIDLAIVISSLVLFLVVGLWAGRGVKTMRQYVLGNGKFSTAALVMTLIATATSSAALLGFTGYVASEGLLAVISSTCIIQLALIAKYIPPKMEYFRKCLTIGDIMEQLYGRYGGMITGLLAFINAGCIAGMEFFMLRKIFESVLGVTVLWPVVLSAIMLAIYTAHGGIRSVVITDVVQFIVIFIGIPIIAYLALDQAGGIKVVLTQIPPNKLAILSNENFYWYLIIFITYSILPGCITSPFVVQRMLMARDKMQMKNMLIIYGVSDQIFNILILVIAFSTFILYPAVAPDQLFVHCLHNLLPIGIKGLAIAGVLSVSLSTLDSFLNISGITAVHNLIKPICDKRKISINELLWAKWSTVFMSVVAILFSLTGTEYTSFLLNAIAFTSPITLIPLIAGIMGLKVDSKSYYASLVVTLVGFVCCKLFMPPAYLDCSLIINVILNGLTFFGVHLYQNNGKFVMAKRENFVVEDKKPECKMFNPLKLAAYARAKVEKYGAPYVMLGGFFVMNYTLPFFLWTSTLPQYKGAMLLIRFIGGVLCALLIANDRWYSGFKKYLPLFWYFTLAYVLPFTGTVMFLATNGSMEWLINVSITLMFLILLVDWVAYCTILALGIGAGVFVYFNFMGGAMQLNFSFDTLYLLVYQLVFGTLIGLLFVRKRQQKWDVFSIRQLFINNTNDKRLLETAQESMRIVEALNKAGIDTLYDSTMLAKQILSKSEQDLGADSPITSMMKQLVSQIKKVAIEVDNIENRATVYLPLELPELPITIVDLIDNVKQDLIKLNLNQGVTFLYRCKQEHTSDGKTIEKTIECDVEKIKDLLVNGIMSMRNAVAEDNDINVVIDDAKLQYTLNRAKSVCIRQREALRFTIVADEGDAEIAIDNTVYDFEFQKSNLQKFESKKELPLQQNKRIAQAHYGYSNIKAKMLFQETQVYVIPWQVRNVRPKEMDDETVLLGAQLPIADDKSPVAKEVEERFLTAVKQKSNARIELVEEAIREIKKYHGKIKRKSGEPYYLHPIEVAYILLLRFNPDEDSILAALLHDTVEDTPAWSRIIALMFNERVRDLVDGVTNIDCADNSCYKLKLESHDTFSKLLDSLGLDKCAVEIKLSDRLHNMRTIGAKGRDSQVKKAKETIEKYVPLATNSGYQDIADELLKLSNDVLNNHE